MVELAVALAASNVCWLAAVVVLARRWREDRADATTEREFAAKRLDDAHTAFRGHIETLIDVHQGEVRRLVDQLVTIKIEPARALAQAAPDPEDDAHVPLTDDEQMAAFEANRAGEEPQHG